MPASGVFALNRAADFGAAVYGVEFLDANAGDGSARSGGGRFFFAAEVLLQAGRAPSHAVAEIPLASWNDAAPAVAGVRGGPLEGLKIGARARAYVYASTNGTAHTLLVGSVVNVRQDLGADGAAVTVLDDRWLLEGVPVAGEFLWDPETQSVTYRQRGPCRFNPHGRPNCLDTPGGPLFAPWPGYGREDGDSDPAPGSATRAARGWRHADIAAYLRRAYATEEFAEQTEKFPYFTRISEDKLLIPQGFGAELLGDAAADPDDARAAKGYGPNDREGSGEAAKAPDLALEGLDLLSALTRAIESAGAYALYCSPEGDGETGCSVLEIVPARFVDGSAAGVSLARPAAGNALAEVPPLSVSGGGMEEDAAELYTAVAVAGDAPALEIRLAYASGGGQGLTAAWTGEDEKAFRDYIGSHPDHPNSRQAFLEAAWNYPRVFAAYHVEENFDWLSGTKYAGFPRATKHPPALPDLSTAFSEMSSGGRRREFPYPITVELKDNSGSFRVRSTLDGLEVDDDGTVWLPALREAGLIGDENGTWKGAVSNPAALTPRELRMTLALRLDHRLVAAFSLPGAGLRLPAADPNGDAARISPGLQRTYWADAEGAYREHLRKSSWPVPQSVSGSSAATDRAADGEELLSDAPRAGAHAQRRLAEVARARRSGRLVFPRPAILKPGTMVDELVTAGTGGAYPVRGIVWRVLHDYRRNETEIELT